MWNPLARRITIWYVNRTTAEYIYNTMLDFLPKDSIRKIRHSAGQIQIEMMDGSVYDFAKPGDNRRGMAVHESYFADIEEMDKGLIHAIVFPCTKSFHNECNVFVLDLTTIDSLYASFSLFRQPYEQWYKSQ